MRRFIAWVQRLLDAVLPTPPEDDAAAIDARGDLARLRLRWRLTEKQGKGGNR